MKILLLSRWFFPAKNPRAFRTTELVRELLERGYEIDFFCPQDAFFKGGGHDRLHIYRIPVSSPLKSKETTLTSDSDCICQLPFMRQMKKIFLYLLGAGGRDVIYSVRLYRALKKNVCFEKYDALLAISYPFYLLVAAAGYMFHNKDIYCKVADCGDPLYCNPSIRKAPYLKYVERFILQKFDWITVPMQEAMIGYRHCNLGDRLKVVPQGLKLLTIEDGMYHPNQIPTFCYAGVFYETIRNPGFFFEFLCKIEEPFYFIVYALDDMFTQQILIFYKKFLGEKLVVKRPVEREQLVGEMAKMDFVLNFDNENSNQKPSKLIDYAMSRRPILSFNSQTFRPDVFREFLNRDYRKRYYVDLKEHDIRHVVDQFESLFNKGSKKEVH